MNKGMAISLSQPITECHKPILIYAVLLKFVSVLVIHPKPSTVMELQFYAPWIMEIQVTFRTHYSVDITDAYAQELEDNNRPRRGE